PLFIFSPRPTPQSTLFPYTTLFRSPLAAAAHEDGVVRFGELELRRLQHGDVVARLGVEALEERRLGLLEVRQLLLGEPVAARRVDRKSTRLNSSHVSISYAVFCLKK